MFSDEHNSFKTSCCSISCIRYVSNRKVIWYNLKFLVCFCVGSYFISRSKTFVPFIVLMYVILLLKGARSRFTCSFSNKPEVSHFIPLVDSYTLPSLLSAVVAYNLLLYDNIEEGRLFLNGFFSKEFETHDIAFPFCAIYTLRTLSTTE